MYRSRSYGWLPFVALLVGAGVLPFVAGQYAVSIGLELLMWVALTESWLILSGMAGYISLGHVVFYGLGAYLIVLTWGQVPLWLGLPLAGAVSFVFAVLISLPVLRVRGPYFVILTFGIAELIKFIVMAVEAGLGQFGRMLFDVPPFDVLYWLMFALAGTATVAALVIRSTRLGEGLTAIREDEIAAQSIGVPVVRYKAIAFGLSAIVPGMVGAVMALRTTYFEPQEVFDPMISFTIVTMAIMGGSDDARGPLFGAAFLTLLSELLWDKAPQVYMIILGVFLISFVLLLPRGLCGWLYPLPMRRK